MMLYERTLYTKPVKFLIHSIYEYDIAKANVSILRQEGAITEEQYHYYIDMDKQEREISIGYLQKSPKVLKALSDGFINARRKLFEVNHLQDSDVLAIKRDAIFSLERLQELSFGYIQYIIKNEYDMYVYCGKLEIYFKNSNELSNTYNIEVKGIRDDVLQKHTLYLTTLGEVLSLITANCITEAISYWISFMKQYDAMQLDIGYYRELNSNSMYKLYNKSYWVDTVDNRILIDKGYNAGFNREFLGILMSIFTM